MSGSGIWIWIPNADPDSGSRPKLNTDLTGSGSKTLLAMQVMFTNLGIKIPGIQDQNIAMIFSDNNKINETMLQDIHSLNKQNMNSVQNIISGDCLTKESREELKGGLT
jgi:hypothetical protein